MQRADSLEKSDAGKDWRQEKKGATEDEVVTWHHWLSGQEFEQTLGDSEGQGSLGVVQSTELQRVKHDLEIKQQQIIVLFLGLVVMPPFLFLT